MRLLRLDYVMTSYTNAPPEACPLRAFTEVFAVAQTPWVDHALLGNCARTTPETGTWTPPVTLRARKACRRTMSNSTIRASALPCHLRSDPHLAMDANAG